MIELSDCYHVLGVSHTASEKEIKRAYHREALKYHPDKNKGLFANQRFQQINEAFNTLTHDKKLGEDQHKTSVNTPTATTDISTKNLFDQLFSEELKSFRCSSELRTTSTTTTSTATTTTTTTTTFSSFSTPNLSAVRATTTTSNHNYSVPEHDEHGERDDLSRFSSLFFDFFPEYQSCGHQQRCTSNKRPLYNNSSYITPAEVKRLKTARADNLDNGNPPVMEERKNARPSPPDKTTTSTARCSTTTASPCYTRVGDSLITTLNLTLTEALTGFKKQIPKFCSSNNNSSKQYYLIENHHRVIKSGQIDVFYGEGVPNETTGVKGNLIIQYQVQLPAYPS